MYFKSDPPMEIKDAPQEMKWTCSANRLVIEIVDETEKTSLAELIAEHDLDALLDLTLPIANRCLMAIRNYGIVPSLHEITPVEGTQARDRLAEWHAEIAGEVDVWTQLVAPTKVDSLWFLLRSQQSGPAGELDSKLWLEVQESVEDNLTIPPEREFLANSVEHLRNRNFRYSLLESIIGLEIVLARFLSASLRINYDLSKRRIDKFLTPELGLTARVSALLNIMLPANEIKEIDLDKILEAIKIRNHVIHKTGRLPASLSGDEVTMCIKAVLSLVLLVARKREQTEIRPKLQEIANQLFANHGISKPFIWLGKGHNIGVAFSTGIIFEKPDEDVVHAVITDAGRLLRRIDKRFNPQEHLYVKFSNLMDTEKLEWYQGEIRSR